MPLTEAMQHAARKDRAANVIVLIHCSRSLQLQPTTEWLSPFVALFISGVASMAGEINSAALRVLCKKVQVLFIFDHRT